MASSAQQQPFSEVDTDEESASNRWDSDTDSTFAACSRELLLGEEASSPLEATAATTTAAATSSSFSLPKYGSTGERKGAHHVELSDGLEGKEATTNWGVQNGCDVDLEKGLNFKRGVGDDQDGQQDEEEEEEENDDEEEEEGGESCRVCHLSVHSNSMAGEAMELGCDCKDDLAMAHRHCAEAWFKIKGNRTCEICGSIAQNVEGMENDTFMDHWNEREANTSTPNEPPTRCLQSQPLCNILLACMLLSFILPWLFRVSLF